MRIYVDLKLVKRLAKILNREMEVLGKRMPLGRAYSLVARMFGHDGYEALHACSSYTCLSLRDDQVEDEELARRYEQYLRVLTEHEFTHDEAEDLLQRAGVKSWWLLLDGKLMPRELNEAPAPAPLQKFAHVRRASVKTYFLDPKIPKSLAHQLGKFALKVGVETTGARKELLAKMFGHDSYDDVVVVYGRGVASIEDWRVSPAELDRRAAEYVRVLVDAGFPVKQACEALSQVGCMGWLGIRPDEWDMGVRQAAHVANITQGRRPTGKWRPARAIKNRTAA